MPDLTSCCTSAMAMALTPLLFSCSTSKPPLMPSPPVFQDWQLQPGDRIAGYVITGGLGDISIDVQGQAIYAPFAGEAQQDKQGCLFYRSSEVPAYMFRLCGIHGGSWFGLPVGPLQQLQLGPMRAGAVLGYAHTLQFAALRKQPNGQWAIVEPDQSLIKTLLESPNGEHESS